jgi:hypothetical protein
MKNKLNFLFTLAITCALMWFCCFWLKPGLTGLVLGILYGQTIEWFVHGWIQHHPFRIFSKYRRAHTLHHKHVEEPVAVQPIQYFLIGSIFLLLPFYQVGGFAMGYFTAYFFINVIHYDLHIPGYKILPGWVWQTWYFKWITRHHEAHHTGTKLAYTTYSVTNPFLDILYCKIGFTALNNFIAKHLKI